MAQRAIYRVDGVFTLRSTEKVYNGTRGVLSNYSPTPGARKILQPRPFRVTWETLLPSPI